MDTFIEKDHSGPAEEDAQESTHNEPTNKEVNHEDMAVGHKSPW